GEQMAIVPDVQIDQVHGLRRQRELEVDPVLHFRARKPQVDRPRLRLHRHQVAADLDRGQLEIRTGAMSNSSMATAVCISLASRLPLRQACWTSRWIRWARVTSASTAAGSSKRCSVARWRSASPWRSNFKRCL